MSVPPPSVPAGWYDDPANPAQKKYWDGNQWTEHTAPAAAVPGPKAGLSPLARGLVIAGSIIGGLIVLSIIAGAVGAASRGPSNESAPAAASQTPTPTATPTPTPTPTATPTEAAPVVDVAAFKSQAHSHLDDMSKDLDDMVVTLNEGGFWRLLSNSVELSFNIGQLSALDVPPAIAQPYADALAGMEATVSTLDDATFDENAEGSRAAIDSLRAQIAALRGVVDQAP